MIHPTSTAFSRRANGLVSLLLVGAALVLWVPPATANCHIATWDSDRVRVEENAGRVELAIELDGRGNVTCKGSVRWRTVNGSAVAPGDYKASSGDLSWTPGSERRRTVSIPIVSDVIVEPNDETFHVDMTAGPGGISVEQVGPGEGGPRVSVLITDDDGVASPTNTLSPSPNGRAGAPGSGGNSGVIVGIVVGVLALGALAALLLRRRTS